MKHGGGTDSRAHIGETVKRLAFITISRFYYPGYAECEQCENLHPDATRARVRVHVQDTGHTARYVIEDVTRYERNSGTS